MRKIKILLIAALLILGGLFLNSVNAEDINRNMKVAVSRLNGDVYTYTVSGGLSYPVIKIYDVNDINQNNQILYSNAIYCLRGNVGFTDENPVAYTQSDSYDMFKNSESVISKYKHIYSVVKPNVAFDRTLEIHGEDVNIYNAILFIIDKSYLPNDKFNSINEKIYDAEENKKELLTAAGIPLSQQNEITDNDIEVIQQLAIWYFTNYDEQLEGNNSSLSQSTMYPANSLSINNNDNIDRADNLNKLYQYLVNGAIENNGVYGTGDNREIVTLQRLFDKTIYNENVKLKTESVEEENRFGELDLEKCYYKVGPIKISRNQTIPVELKDIGLFDNSDSKIKRYYYFGENESDRNEIFYFIDSNDNVVDQLQPGTEYYIIIKKLFTKGFNPGSTTPFQPSEEYKYDVSTDKNLTIRLYTTKINISASFLYTDKTQNPDQAIVEIEKEKETKTDEIVYNPKPYDLSLRKFITSINGVSYDRLPRLDLSKLNTLDTRKNKQITTARYIHPKNKLQVEENDKVIYTIRVYNEGETDGKALEITDYLPEGLELVPATDSSINRTYRWANPSGDGKTITTDYLKDTVIKAYDLDKTNGDESIWQKATEGGASGLYYADVKVECKVVATSNNISLKNIAEITSDDGDDRDSVPGTVPTEYNPGPEDEGYFPGDQDDDDYEDLVLKEKKFDLALRKYISKVERQNEELQIVSREPVIKIADLKNNVKTTATYIHEKNTLSLKRGDIITYKLRIYNEGDIDGYATKVTDYIPDGLELVEGRNDIWTVNGNKITTEALSNQKILAYNRAKAEETAGWQRASDDNTGLYYLELEVVCRIKDTVSDNQRLVNIAEIFEDRAEGIDLDDRDSEPGNFPDSKKNNNYSRENEKTPDGYYPGIQDDDDYEPITVEPIEVFDLALRKSIVAVNDVALQENESRLPNIDLLPLDTETTADYKHKKDPVEVNPGDIVTYRFTTYNEGDIDGNVYSIVDYLPAGLEFDATENESNEYTFNVEGNKLTIGPKSGDKLFEISSFNGTTLDSKTIDVKFKVTAQESNNDQILTNVATMTYGAKNSNIADRDSSEDEFTIPTAEKLLEGLPGYKGNVQNKEDLTDATYHYEGQQDDDDFEKIIIKGKPFDLSLRKFITSIKRNGAEVEFDDRTPDIDLTTLINGTYNRNGRTEYTATYNHSKEPLIVKKGDIITYTLRIYNEGARDGYASEITDYIPEGLALIVDYNTNFENSWRLPNVNDLETMDLIGEEGFYKTEEDVKNLKIEDFTDTDSLKDVKLVKGKVKITTTELDDELIKAYDSTVTSGEGWQKAEVGQGGLYYKDVQVTCLVVAENTYKDTITNVAEISEDKDKYKNPVDDRDSVPNDINEPYGIWEEDDDDYEPVVLKYFDLALRKFITGVETNGTATDVTTRIPQLSLNEGEGNLIKYKHPKEEAPVYVANNDIVIYTLRIYNEGTLEGYAEEITDDIPEGLIYLPNHVLNKQYEWKMYDEEGNETEELINAKTIKTDYLSQDKETSERQNLINPFDSSMELGNTNPDYKDVKVAFRVIEPNTSDRVLVNSAQISEDSGDDEDSIPDEWNEGEDDQDKEYVYVKYFDLSLLKWVTQTIVSVDGKTITTETGFKPNTGKTETTGIRDNTENEPVAKVELDKKKLNKTTVKFVYKIRVTNEGEISGYATELTDFIPAGLEFKEEDNSQYGWTKTGEDKVTTRAIETKLLQPGESAEVSIIFTWKNDKNNLGVKTNIAEITEDYNEHNSKDIDSTPNNKENPYDKEQEDDDDFALVVLSLKTGKGASYTILTLAVVTMLTSGIYLIKKYVLTY